LRASRAAARSAIFAGSSSRRTWKLAIAMATIAGMAHTLPIITVRAISTMPMVSGQYTEASRARRAR
jgi:hypothetical protein